jgi:hypothetical protein
MVVRFPLDGTVEQGSGVRDRPHPGVEDSTELLNANVINSGRSRPQFLH